MSDNPADSISSDDLVAYQDRNARLEARVADLEDQLATAHKVAKAHETNAATVFAQLEQCSENLDRQRDVNRRLTRENHDLVRENEALKAQSD